MTKIQKILKERKKTVYWLTMEIKFNKTNGRLAALGRLPATVPMRAKIAEVLEVPVETIFDSEGLALREE